MEISHKAVKFEQLLSKMFREVYSPSGSLGPYFGTNVDTIPRWQVTERVGHLSL